MQFSFICFPNYTGDHFYGKMGRGLKYQGSKSSGVKPGPGTKISGD